MTTCNTIPSPTQHQTDATIVAAMIRRVIRARLPYYKVRVSACRTGVSGVVVTITTTTIPAMYDVAGVMHRMYPRALLFKSKYVQGHCPGLPLPGGAWFISDEEVAA